MTWRDRCAHAIDTEPTVTDRMTSAEFMEAMADRFVGVRAADVHPDEILRVKWSDLVELFTDPPVTSGGVVLTPKVEAELVAEAERGYDPESLRPVGLVPPAEDLRRCGHGNPIDECDRWLEDPDACGWPRDEDPRGEAPPEGSFPDTHRAGPSCDTGSCTRCADGSVPESARRCGHGNPADACERWVDDPDGCNPGIYQVFHVTQDGTRVDVTPEPDERAQCGECLDGCAGNCDAR
jgi:hypothetical protein